MRQRPSIADLLGPAGNVVRLRFALARGDGNNLGRIRSTEEVSWRQFCDELSTPQVDRKHSHTEFLALPDDRRKELKKQSDWINTGAFRDNHLTNESCVSRSMIAMDLDDVSPALLKRIERGEFLFEFFAHITRSSTPEAPRIRIYVPTDSPIAKADYADAVRECAKIFGLDPSKVDDCSFTPKTLMYLPQVSRDQDYWHHVNEGPRWKPPAPTKAEDGGLSIIAHNKKFFASFDELSSVVRSIKNNGRIDWYGWRDILGAVAFESDGSDDGRELMLEFSERWTEADHDEEYFNETWASYVRNQKARIHKYKFKTGRYLLELALADGYRRPIAGNYEADEQGVCLAFEDAHKDQLRYDEDRGCWFVLRAGIWRPRGNRYAHYWARMACIDIAESIGKKGAGLRRASTWNAIEGAERKNPAFAVEHSHWNPDPFLLGTPAGVVDLRTGRMRDPDPEDRITKLTRVAPLEKFDPKRDCPVWLKFLDQVCAGDQDLIRFLQQYAGYSLTGDVREHKLVFIFGGGGNGKGVFQSQIRLVLGDYAVVANMATFAESKFDRHLTELAALAGARLVVASETEEGRAWAETRLKACTGGDPITARWMRQDEFTYEPEFKLLFIGNHKPNLHNVDDAIKRRMNIVPFDYKPKVVDQNLGEKLRREWPAILAWMIDGCLDWQKNGLIVPGVVKRANAAYFQDQDTFQRWIDDCCEVGREYVATSAALFDSYAAYAGLRGEIAATRNKSFPDLMRKHNFQAVKDEFGIRGRGFRGIRLKVRNEDSFEDLTK